MTDALTLDDIRPVLGALGREPVAFAAMAGGSAAVFRIDCAGGETLALKTYPDHLPWAPAKDVYVSNLIRDRLDVPVARWLTTDDTKTRLRLRFAITTYLPGATVDSLQGEPDIEDAYRQMGALLKQLHGVDMPAYGAIGANGVVNPFAANADYMRAMFAEHFRRFREMGGDAALTARLERAAEARIDLAAYCKGPVFGHDDVHPGNVLAARDADGRLKICGLIDFGNARAVDPLSDLAKAIFCSAHMDPRSAAAIREGYGAIDHPDPQGAMWLYTLLHRVMMWWWIRHIGGKPDEGSLPGLICDLDAMVR